LFKIKQQGDILGVSSGKKEKVPLPLNLPKQLQEIPSFHNCLAEQIQPFARTHGGNAVNYGL